MKGACTHVCGVGLVWFGLVCHHGGGPREFGKCTKVRVFLFLLRRVISVHAPVASCSGSPFQAPRPSLLARGLLSPIPFPLFSQAPPPSTPPVSPKSLPSTTTMFAKSRSVTLHGPTSGPHVELFVSKHGSLLPLLLLLLLLLLPVPRARIPPQPCWPRPLRSPKQARPRWSPLRPWPRRRWRWPLVLLRKLGSKSSWQLLGPPKSKPRTRPRLVLGCPRLLWRFG